MQTGFVRPILLVKQRWQRIARLTPGLALSLAITALALALPNELQFPWLSPLLLALLGGMALRCVLSLPLSVASGTRFCGTTLLRVGIMLLGIQVTSQHLGALGFASAAAIIANLAATFAFTACLGWRMGIDQKLTLLIAAGSSVCGASAVLGANAVARGSEEDVGYAIGCVTLFGTLLMVLCPIVGEFLDLAPHEYGLWVGVSVHEVAQVIVAAFQGGQEAGEIGTTAKMVRVLMLAPLLYCVSQLAASRTEAGKSSFPRVPWFVLGFAALVTLNSSLQLPALLKEGAAVASKLLLVMALAAVGLETRMRGVGERGWKPLVLSFAATLFVASVGLLLVCMLK